MQLTSSSYSLPRTCNFWRWQHSNRVARISCGILCGKLSGNDAGMYAGKGELRQEPKEYSQRSQLQHRLPETAAWVSAPAAHPLQSPAGTRAHNWEAVGITTSRPALQAGCNSRLMRKSSPALVSARLHALERATQRRATQCGTRLDVQLPVWCRHLLVLCKGVLLHPARLQAEQRAPQVAVAARRQARRKRGWQRQLLRRRHSSQLLLDLRQAGRRHTDAQASAAHRLDDLGRGRAGGRRSGK